MLDRTLSVLAIIISVFTLLFSFWQYNDSQKSIVNIRIKPVENYLAKKIMNEQIDQEKRIKFEVLLSNTGAKKTTIVDFRVLLSGEIESKRHSQIDKKRYSIWIKAHNPILLNTSLKPLSYPFVLESEESIKFYLELSIDINTENEYIVSFDKNDGSSVSALFSPTSIFSLQGER